MPPEPAQVASKRNVSRIARLFRQQQASLTRGERISAGFSRVIGSLWFVVAHAAGFLLWASWNTLAPERFRFDPFPFGLMTMFVSLEGVLVAAFVLVNQNRLTVVADRRAHLHLQIALLAEQEATMLLRMVRTMAQHVQAPVDPQDTSLEGETDLQHLLEEIEREVPVE